MYITLRLTPYINESEFANKFANVVKNCASIPIRLQLLKGRAYYKIGSQEIESYLAKLRRTCGVGAIKAEYCSMNNIRLNDRHIRVFVHLQTKYQNIFEGYEVANESRNKAKVKSTKQYTQKRKWTSNENLLSLTIKITINELWSPKDWIFSLCR